MIKETAIVSSQMGIHARPAALIASVVAKSESDVIFRIDGIEIDPSKYIKLLSFHVKCGTKVEIIVDGKDEEAVLKELVHILQTAV